MTTHEQRESVFLISPVHNITQADITFLDNYIESRARTGVDVYVPYRHTKQDGDDIGLRILSDNCEAIRKAHRIEIFYKHDSAGSVFDLGAAFMIRKTVSVINPDETTRHLDTFATRFLRYQERYNPRHTKLGLMPILDARRTQILQEDVVKYQWCRTQETLFDFGMTFMANKPVLLLNPDKVKRTQSKSFENVLLALHEKYTR